MASEIPDFICGTCTTNSYLKKWISTRGASSTACGICGGTPAVAFGLFAQHVAQGLEKRLRVLEPDDDVGPVGLDEAVQQAAGTSEVMSKTLARSAPWPETLRRSPRHLCWADRWAGDHLEGWSEFKRRLHEESRYFGSTRTTLEQLFGRLDRHLNGAAIDTLDKGTRVYRARRVNESDAAGVVRRPTRELAAPPPDLATAGRMNSAGMPVFYGAFSEQVAIAEVRPPVGSRVAFAAFTPTTCLKVLSLGSLRAGLPKEETFNPAFREILSRHLFFRELDEEIAQPALPAVNDTHYLATQVFAEYVMNVEELDGIRYSSAQVPKGDQRENQNVVLFRKASHVREGREKDRDAGLKYVAGSARVVEVTGVSVEYKRDWRNTPGHRRRRDSSL